MNYRRRLVNAVPSDSLKVADLADHRIVIWGYGTEGKAAARLLLEHATPVELTIVVDAEQPPAADLDLADIEVRSARDVDFGLVDAIVKSPGVSPYHGQLAVVAARYSIPVTGGTALWFAETNGDRTIAVTGSKGKSTTSTLIAHLLSSVGHPATLAGNVGRPLLDVLDEDLRDLRDLHSGQQTVGWYVVETSSFQTAEVRNSPEIGVLTALFPEHLDWHESVDRYYADKCNLFSHRDGIRVAVNADNANVADRLGAISGARPYGTDSGLHALASAVCCADGAVLLDTAGSALRGRHNVINLCGALTAIEAAGVDLAANIDALNEAVQVFRPLSHRLEPVGELSGRLVIDDSLSTAPEAAVAALAAFGDRPIGIIVGGHDRGLDYTSLAQALAARTAPTWVCGVPMSGERIVPLIERVLRDRGVDPTLVQVRAFDDFDEAVGHAANVVPDGGVILLSPAAPSFGRFANYAERGRHFRELLGFGML